MPRNLENRVREKKYILFVFFLVFSVFQIVTANSMQKDEKSKREQSATPWWKHALVYQIYPRSFMDSNGDGIGDLKGIISKLDYLKNLGIDAVWLNPIYASPNDDNGYDISDYRKIMTEFGTMTNFDSLLVGLHKRGIRLIMDLVVNHSSDEHYWFKQSRSSRTNSYRDYYHWWPAEKGKPTPRWSSFDVNHDAWKYDSLTNAYYLHYFSQKQPDLNWENPKVRQEVYEIMKFWIDKGVDGFRMDAFQFVAKDITFPEFPSGYEKDIIKYYGMGPHIHDYLQEMNRVVLQKNPNIMTVAEGAGSTLNDAHDLVDASRHELNLAYHFEAMDIGTDPVKKYSVKQFKDIFSKWDSAFAQNGWLAIFLANHDQPRMVSKYGNDSPAFREASSKMLTTFILTMRGTPFYYNGDELGMKNISFVDINDYKDIAAINGYKNVLKTGGDVEAYMSSLRFTSRDNARTPIQWNTSNAAGFTSGIPWIKVNPDFYSVNAENEEKDPNSCLNYFRKAVKLRKTTPALLDGSYRPIEVSNNNIYAFTRSFKNQVVCIVLNFSSNEQTVNFPFRIGNNSILLNNYTSLNIKTNSIILQPCQAIVFKIK
jgi:oligo-1,6-glucosidase